MDEIDEKKKRCELPGVRYLFALNAAIGYCAIYALCMNTRRGYCGYGREFVWSREMRVVLGAFYYGYCFSQIPGGRLAEVYSGKWVFGISTLIVAILTLLTPLAARLGVEYLIAIRALEGLAQVS
ncbi:hypothetical protein CDAR_47061 [Caerostris darwini]|uniref:Major facilitator superfamily (MFS) profile domain-containing protein n=1 Tax=Caerostris darwini TaxID=1538125 RepID=A0AAV4UA87_9ARAC|nr:hypothetical protein CDAR_47061 [Caerostris darwini]